MSTKAKAKVGGTLAIGAKMLAGTAIAAPILMMYTDKYAYKIPSKAANTVILLYP